MNQEKLKEMMDAVQRTAVCARETAADAAYGISKAAAALADTAKTHIALADLKRRVNLRLREAGEMVYATHTGEPTASDELVEKLREIDALKAEITALQAQLGVEEEGPVCPTCGAEPEENDAFCRHCGGKL